MTSLLVEYRKRWKSDYIPVIHDGLCFFDLTGSLGLPYSEKKLIAMTSLSCRSFSNCAACDEKNTNVIVEVFIPGYNGTFALWRHEHVPFNTDLNSKIKELYPGVNEYKPFYAKNIRSLEHWLWDFTFGSRKWKTKLNEKDAELRKTELMANVAIQQPKLYNIYYLAYEAFLLSRKYMLFA